MDLHIVAPLASLAERAAVDSVLTPVIGPASSAWDGGERTAADLRVARGGHEARSHRDLLLPALHAVQDRVGWISEPALGYICRRLTLPPAEAYGVATFYALLSTEPQPRAAVHVCDDMACRLAGADDLCRDLERDLGPAGTSVPGAAATWHRSPCLGQCERAPAALFTIADDPPIREKRGHVTSPEILRILEAGLTGIADAGEASLPTAPTPERLSRIRRFVPQAGQPGLRLLARVGLIDPTSLADFLANGGYRALDRAIAVGPRRVIEEVIASDVLGRGGAAFPTGRKWAATAAATGWPKYVICNADEAEPGTFKDRAFLEEDPFHIVEAMTIAGFAVGAEKGYLYVRGEYPLGEARMANAIKEARTNGLLGDDVMNAGFAFDIELRRGAGAYICGEETALFESIAGQRPEPRNKPPFPVDHGLFGKPTAINNVETLATIPGIVLEGGAAFAALGSPRSTGHKLFSISGDIERPGVYEVEFGTTLRELIALAGGVPGGRSVQAINLGGAAGVFVGPRALGMPLTFEHARELGATLGAGAIIVFDETRDLLDALRRIARFFRDESCGQCVPCRVGTVRQEELLARLAEGRGDAAEELALLADLGRVMRDASICGLGQMASSALESAFRDPSLVTLTTRSNGASA